MTTNFNYNHLAELVGNVVDQKIVSLHELFVQENAKLRQDLLEKMSQLEQTMNGKMDDLENKLNGKMDDLESTLNSQMNNLDKVLNGRVDNLESTLNNKIASIQNQLTSKIDSAISDMNDKVIQATTSIIKFDNVIKVVKPPSISSIITSPDVADKFFYIYNLRRYKTDAGGIFFSTGAGICGRNEKINLGATNLNNGEIYFFY